MWLACVWRRSRPAPPTRPLGYYRFPALAGDLLVFTAEGDLWKTTVNGGVPERLTAHPGEETDAALSPDAKWVAFTGTYEGPEEAYVLPLDGGPPRRLTWDGGPVAVVSWTPDGKVLCSTRRYSTLPNASLIAIDPVSGVADRGAAGAGQRRRLRRRRHAVLHAPAVPGQPDAALQGRHRAAALAIGAGRPGGRARDRRFCRARASGR